MVGRYSCVNLIQHGDLLESNSITIIVEHVHIVEEFVKIMSDEDLEIQDN